MVTQDDLRRIALALPAAYEDMHRKRPAFRVETRIFAMLGAAGGGAVFTSLGWDDVAVVKLDCEDQLNLAAGYQGAVEPTETYGHHGWTYLRLDQLDEAALSLVLQLAWAHVAPKRLIRAHFPSA
ncbi:MAG TPA: MmcQ/YjbR family DNA-binding protein [Caulobacteraceae bacterium]|nr:MmcQ/YjbR family DNA-binding protein [Caulobacteraceae bacterium]